MQDLELRMQISSYIFNLENDFYLFIFANKSNYFINEISLKNFFEGYS